MRRTSSIVEAFLTVGTLTLQGCHKCNSDCQANGSVFINGSQINTEHDWPADVECENIEYTLLKDFLLKGELLGAAAQLPFLCLL